MEERETIGGGPGVAWQLCSEERLVCQCVQGDENAWGQLVDRYKSLVHSIIRRSGLSDDEASDAFQAVFFEIIRGLPALREPKALVKWIIQISWHESRRVRRGRRLIATKDADLEAMIEPSQDLPESAILELERQQQMREAIASLSPRCQKLLEMLFYEEQPRTYAETAATLGLASGSIGFIRGRCLHKLKRLLDPPRSR